MGKMICVIAILVLMDVSMKTGEALMSVPEPFQDTVQPPRPSEDNVYRFHLELEYGLTMTWVNRTTGLQYPVSLVNGRFHYRDVLQPEACGVNYPVPSEDVPGIVKVDGQTRRAILINGMIPGPPIVVPLGATVQVAVFNNLLTEGISMHFHGQTQQFTNHMDGVGMITELPIYPGETFVYNFTATEAGTHWYHAHHGLEKADGAYGPFTVVPPERLQETPPPSSQQAPTFHTRPVYFKESDGTTSIEAVGIDREYHFLLQDWSWHDALSAFEYFVFHLHQSPGPLDTPEACSRPQHVTDRIGMFDITSPMINGKGWFGMSYWDQEDPEPNAYHYYPTMARFNIKAGERILFRIVGASQHRFKISVDNHKLFVIAADGNDIKTINGRDGVDSLTLHSGERYDAYIEAQPSPDGRPRNYWIRVTTIYNVNELGILPEKEFFGRYEQRRALGLLKYGETKDDYSVDNSVSKRCLPSLGECTNLNCENLIKRNLTCFEISDAESVQTTPVAEENDLESMLTTTQRFSPDEFQEFFFNFLVLGLLQKMPQRMPINGIGFRYPRGPPLLHGKDFEKTLFSCDEVERVRGLKECTQIHHLDLGKITQIVIMHYHHGMKRGPVAHPIHLHGHHFRVVKTGVVKVDRGLDEEGLPSLIYPEYPDIECIPGEKNATETKLCNEARWTNESWSLGNVPDLNPDAPCNPRKDTISVPEGTYAVIRFVTRNPGYWFLHCHNDIHLVAGMSLVFQEGTPEEIGAAVPYEGNLNSLQRHKRPEGL